MKETFAEILMNCADAPLVVLAHELEIDRVLTLDERGFCNYRHGRNHPFRLILLETEE